MIRRRRRFRFLAIMLLVGLLAACGSAAPPVAQTSPADSAAPAPSADTNGSDPEAEPAATKVAAQVWSPDGKAMVWTTSTTDGVTGTITITSIMDGTAATLGTIAVPLPGAAAVPVEIDRARLHWLPAGAGLLLALPPAVLLEGGGTYLVRDGTAKLISPHQLCDLASDGKRMIALTSDNMLVIVRLADGGIETQLGPGLAAAWRPEPHGSPPPTPLADRSPRLTLTTPPIQGAAVNELQQLLAAQGFDVGPVDGIFGERTQRAVRDFQQSAGLAVDGIVGPRTWAALRFDAQRTTQQFLNEP